MNCPELIEAMAAKGYWTSPVGVEADNRGPLTPGPRQGMLARQERNARVAGFHSRRTRPGSARKAGKLKPASRLMVTPPSLFSLPAKRFPALRIPDRTARH